MNTPRMLQRHPALRWLAPLGVAGVAALAATGAFTAGASTDRLPATTPAALIAAVQHTDVSGFSGTVVSHLSLGLPELPAFGNAGDGTSFTSLLSGSHTLQVWYGAEDQQRIALLGSTEESDVFRDGRQLWQWSSADRVAVHTVLPADRKEAGEPTTGPSAALASLTPMQLARQALGAMTPTTGVAVEGHHSVADRSSYDLVLTPRTAQTKIGSIRIAVDGATKLPLGVQVYARNATTPSVDVAFTSIVFGHQSKRNFEFSPPPGATVHQTRLGTRTAGDSPAHAKLVAGSGWTSVVELRPGTRAIAALRRNAVLNSLTPVSGAWGKGNLLDSDLLSALITDDGRVFAGAVEPADLFAAAGRK